MKKILTNIGIIILGIIIGMILNMGLIILGGIIFTPTENIEPMNAINWDLKYFIFPFLAHSVGTLSGSFLVSKLSRNSNIIFPLIVGLYFLSGGIYMVTILPAPMWFVFLDLIVCYIPMSLIGWRISNISK
tara:strand:- start:110 stop:502 length:393 start_codon:yes stop_codon:yes gene_type:complete